MNWKQENDWWKNQSAKQMQWGRCAIYKFWCHFDMWYRTLIHPINIPFDVFINQESQMYNCKWIKWPYGDWDVWIGIILNKIRLCNILSQKKIIYMFQWNDCVQCAWSLINWINFKTHYCTSLKFAFAFYKFFNINMYSTCVHSLLSHWMVLSFYWIYERRPQQNL